MKPVIALAAIGFIVGLNVSPAPAGSGWAPGDLSAQSKPGAKKTKNAKKPKKDRCLARYADNPRGLAYCYQRVPKASRGW